MLHKTCHHFYIMEKYKSLFSIAVAILKLVYLIYICLKKSYDKLSKCKITTELHFTFKYKTDYDSSIIS